MAFRAKIRATIAIASGAKKTKGSSNIWPPGGRFKAFSSEVGTASREETRQDE
jgi:hypothetical protein